MDKRIKKIIDVVYLIDIVLIILGFLFFINVFLIIIISKEEKYIKFIYILLSCFISGFLFIIASTIQSSNDKYKCECSICGYVFYANNRMLEINHKSSNGKYHMVGNRRGVSFNCPRCNQKNEY